jgi:circadian clock protein KaiC
VFDSLLSSGRSPEEHFVAIRRLLDRHAPNCLVVDPISSLLKADYPFSAMICESLLDQAKAHGTTVLCTSLLGQVSGSTELSVSQISTIADTWIHVSYIARDGERNRALTIVKSRGTDHSNQVRELVLSKSGVDLFDVYVAEGEVLMGSARAQKESEAKRLHVLEEIEAQRRGLALERELTELRARVEAATLELGWKQQEAELCNVLEGERVKVQQDAAIQRLDLRRSGDDTSAVVKLRSPRSMV